jgi:signal peptidase I
MTRVPLPGRSVRPADLDPETHAVLHAGEPRAQARGGRLGELPVLIVVALVLAFLIKTFLVQAFYIPSGSMISTLEINDRVLVEKVVLRFRDPRRGEVIVFRRPGAEQEGARGLGGAVRTFFEGLGLVPPNEEIDLIKRVVGLPGEQVEIVGGVVHVDGVPLDEPYAHTDGRDFASVTVPAGHYYMLGDNRPNSDDSRYSLGTVPRENVVGRAFVILWPPLRATFALTHQHPEPAAAGPRGPPGVAGGDRFD